MADTPDPYVRKEPGDIMLAADWNEMQVRARSELRAHTHSDDAASRIPREGIADKAVDGSKIDPESKLTLKGLTLAGPLKVSGTSQLADIKAALANFSGARLTTTGDLGVGTEAPENAEGWSSNRHRNRHRHRRGYPRSKQQTQQRSQSGAEADGSRTGHASSSGTTAQQAPESNN